MPWKSEHHQVSGHTRHVLFVLIGKTKNIREQLCDLQGRNNMYEKPQLIVDLAENLYLLTKLVFRNQIYDYLQFNAMI